MIVDTPKLHTEFQRLAGDVLAPALGREPAAWSEAAAATLPSVIKGYKAALQTVTDPMELFQTLEADRVRLMARWLGCPELDQATAERLGRETSTYVRVHGNTCFPEAPDAIRKLAEQHTVHIGSSIASWTTELELEKMGIRDHVGLAGGPDLVGFLKNSRDFYSALFDLAEVPAQEAIVVDDTSALLEMAESLGAKTVHISADGQVSNRTAITVLSIAHVPSALATPPT